jgi:hypothetical protein
MRALEPPELAAPGPEPPGALRALLLATGGAGVSWPRCVLPFGALAVLAGAAAMAITFSLRGPRLDLAQGVSLATLGTGLGLLAAAFLCWRAQRRRAGRRGAAGAEDTLGPCAGPPPSETKAGGAPPPSSAARVGEAPFLSRFFPNP